MVFNTTFNNILISLHKHFLLYMIYQTQIILF